MQKVGAFFRDNLLGMIVFGLAVGVLGNFVYDNYLKTANEAKAGVQTPMDSRTSYAQTLPDSLSKFEPIELADLVLALIPGTDEDPKRWQFRSDYPSILWLTDGIEAVANAGAYPGDAKRVGQARVHVRGKVATRLGKVQSELGWVVEMAGSRKFGVKYIELYPGHYKENGFSGCFGTDDDNCTFSLEPSLRLKGIQYSKVCEAGGNVIYRIAAEGKPVTDVLESTDGGSGGESTNLVIYQGKSDDGCAK